MQRAAKQRLMINNSAIWCVAIVAAFVLPRVLEALSSGPAKFLQVLGFALPLLAALWVSNAVISRAIGNPVDAT